MQPAVWPIVKEPWKPWESQGINSVVSEILSGNNCMHYDSPIMWLRALCSFCFMVYPKWNIKSCQLSSVKPYHQCVSCFELLSFRFIFSEMGSIILFDSNICFWQCFGDSFWLCESYLGTNTVCLQKIHCTKNEVLY